MAKIFLDTNIFIDLVEKRGQIIPEDLDGNDLLISPLSIHILMYVTKQKVPYQKLDKIIDSFLLVPFDETIAHYSKVGPTADFEDNVQLHSTAVAQCDLFLTNDEKLLDMTFFGKTRIVSSKL